MKEYIERDALYEAMNSQDCEFSLIDALALIEEFPAADVVEVRHGKWIEFDECANEGVYCSICHKKVYKIDYAWSNNPVKMKSPYCPNCGTRMDKEDRQ